MRFFISVSYVGSGLSGWQKQENAPSVQELLESAFSTYLRQSIKITGAGRTDSGVHALNYIAHFDSPSLQLNGNRDTIIYKINAILPSNIVLNNICQVGDNAHARFDATERKYLYHVNTIKDPFCLDQSLFYPYKLDIDAMNYAASLILGERDFTSMAKLHSQTKTNICTLISAKWSYLDSSNHAILGLSAGKSHLCFEIVADRFLRNMVRAIVGTLLEIGRGREKPEWILEVLSKKNRNAAGNSVPAHALFLAEIKYPYSLFTE